MGYKEDIQSVYKQVLPWEKMSGANILVTGATGLIGGCLVETLMMNPKRDYQVYASGRNEERARARFGGFADDAAFHFVKYDVMQPLESDVRFDYIIHAASNANPKFYATQPVEVILVWFCVHTPSLFQVSFSLLVYFLSSSTCLFPSSIRLEFIGLLVVAACGVNAVLEAAAATIICAAVFAGLFVAGKKHSKLSEEK